MAGTLTKIPKLHPTPTPDPRWKVVGVAPNRSPLYEETRARSRAVPDIDPVTNERRFAKHGTTGEPLYPKNKPERYIETYTFFLESDGQGNIYKQRYTPPTPEELAADARRAQIAAVVPSLAEALVDAGITPDELVARLRGDSEVKQEITYPHMTGPGLWVLSDGTQLRGKKAAAQEAEAAVAAVSAELADVGEDAAERARAAADSAATPEF